MDDLLDDQELRHLADRHMEEEQEEAFYGSNSPHINHSAQHPAALLESGLTDDEYHAMLAGIFLRYEGQQPNQRPQE